MKEKILTLIKPLFASKGLSADELESLASIAAQNLTQEASDEDVKNAASGLEPIAELMQKVGNRYASKVENKYKGYVKPEPAQDPKPLQDPKQEPKSEPKPVVTEPQLTKKDVDNLVAQALAEALKPYQQEREAQRLQNLLNNNDKVKSIPESFRRNYKLESEDKLEELADRIEADYTELKQEQIKSGQFVEPPTQGDPNADGNDALIEALHKMSKS